MAETTTKAKPSQTEGKSADERAAERARAQQLEQTPTPREVQTGAVSGAIDPLAAIRGPAFVPDADEPMVDVVVPKSFILTGDGDLAGVSHQFRAGVQRVAKRLLDHWYVKANGVQPLSDVSKSHVAVRAAEDAEIMAMRAKEDSDLAAKRGAEDRAEMEGIARERQANMSKQEAVAAGIDPEVARKRADEDQRRAQKRSQEDAKAPPDEEVRERRTAEDAEINKRREEEDKLAREKLVPKAAQVA